MKWSGLPRRRTVLPVFAVLVAVGSLVVVAAPVGAVRSTRTLHVDVSVPSVLAASGSKIWVANTGTASVLEFNAKTGNEVHYIHGHKDQLFDSDAMVVIGSKVWTANSASDSITILDAKSGDVVRILNGVKDHFAASPIALAVAAKHVFVLGAGGSAVVELSSSTDKLVRVLRGPGFHFSAARTMAVSGQDVWVLSTRPAGVLTELDGATGDVLRIVTAAKASLDDPTALAADGNVLWVANGEGDHVSELESSNGRMLAAPTITHLDGNAVTSILAVDGRLWLASSASPAWVACARVSTHRLVHIFLKRFGFPAVFGGAGHAWVVDRTQSRVTEFNPLDADVVRVLVN
jgi:DNA-binding beta-propeller fold protein YncE